MPPIENRASHDSEASSHVRRAAAGDGGSLAWLVERFSPPLLLQAEQRMGAILRAECDPADIVNDVWLVALRRLPGFVPEDGFAIRTLMRFLGTVLLRHVRDLYKRRLRRTAHDAAEGNDAGLGRGTHNVEELSATATGVVTMVLRAERGAILRQSIASLDAEDREIVTRRAIEGDSTEEVAADLGLTANHVSVKLHRALAKLRTLIPASVFGDLDEPA